MSWRIERLTTDGPLFEGAIDVYSRAFAEPPYSDPGRGDEIRSRMVEVHCLRQGYRAFCAVEREGRVVGMIYGYHGLPGQWWHDTVGAALSEEAAGRWLSDSYEVVEVAVAPESQGQGIGAALVRDLLDGLPEATAVLSTRTDSRAHVLYGRLGFEVVTTMRFAPRGAPFYVMGLDLRPGKSGR
ncbi:MAG: GNAT family N-acetyltransferase [Thermoflexaceae bacterium]|nr:GNAT family N-acetyltransferase [Thermoflexaceae bacterium]